jgi:hypothetical protein
MTQQRDIKFEGRIVRIEPDGFGLVQFDQPISIGEKTITIGVISTSGAGVVSGTVRASPRYVDLKPGARVKGTAEADDQHAMASIKTIGPSF